MQSDPPALTAADARSTLRSVSLTFTPHSQPPDTPVPAANKHAASRARGLTADSRTTEAPTSVTPQGQVSGGSQRVLRRSGGNRRLPPVSPVERARRSAWGKEWGSILSGLAADKRGRVA